MQKTMTEGSEWKLILLFTLPLMAGNLLQQLYNTVDGIIVVTSPQELVSMIVAKAVNMAKALNVPVMGLVENMSYFICPNCNEKHYIFGETKLDALAKEFGISATAQIPMDPHIAELCDEGHVDQVPAPWLKDIIAALS